MFLLNSISMMVLMLFFRIISFIINEIEESLARSSLLLDFRMTELPNLRAKFVEFLELLVSIFLQVFVPSLIIQMKGSVIQVQALLTCSIKCCKVEGNEYHYGKVVKVLQDIFEIITSDTMTDSSRFDVLCLFLFSLSRLWLVDIFCTYTIVLYVQTIQSIGIATLFPAGSWRFSLFFQTYRTTIIWIRLYPLSLAWQCTTEWAGDVFSNTICLSLLSA